jgi:hypothetical protein
VAKFVAVESSILKAVCYDPQGLVLTIAFHNGSVYEYADVPEVIYQDLMGSRSKGKFFHEKILDVYAATRV